MSNISKKIVKGLKHPIATAVHLLGFERTAFIPDKMYLRLAYKFYMGKRLNLSDPKTYHEKLQWIKLYDRKPIYTTMVDKVKARDFVAEKIGPEYLIPILGVWDDPDEIDFDALPSQFVLKCNHNSGTGMCICKDKEKIDITKVKEDLRRGLAENYYYLGREWPYKDVPRKIIGEQYMVDESGDELKDYKVMCFDGEPKLIELHRGRFTDHSSQDFYDVEWNKTSVSQNCHSHFRTTEDVYPKPSTLSQMLAFSRILAAGIPHVRVDWYSINGKLYFGELTFFDGSGFDAYDDPADDLMLGSWITLPAVDHR